MHTIRTTLPLIVFCGAIILVSGVRPATGGDWPNYRGPSHNGISDETSWQSQWGASGPPVLWKTSVGVGFSTTAVADGKVYTMGNIDKSTDVVFCFDAQTGNEIWRHSYPSPLEPKYYEGGTLSTPTVDDGKVYTLGKMGDLFCLDATTGKVIWQKQLNKDMGFALPTWHFSSSALIAGDLLILDIGTAGLALNKRTGEPVWDNGKGKCGYSTPVPFRVDGRQCVAIATEESVVAVQVADGKQVWQFPWKTQHAVNAPDPIIAGNHVFITSGYRRGCGLFSVSGGNVTNVWENKVMSMQINCPILHDGYIYGFDEAIFTCLKLDDGAEQWQDKSLGKGSLMMSADGRLIIMSDRGELVIANADPRKFNVLARAQILPKSRCWTSPVLANGRMYARNTAGDFVCVDVSK